MQSALSLIDRHRQMLIDNGRRFWSMPELAYEEFETSAYAIGQLESFGYQVTKNLSITGFRTELDTGRPGPCVALMGEMDALRIPEHKEARNGLVHGCGHHTHINAMVGAAWALKNCPELLERMCGKIVFIGTPAEEGSNQELCMKYIREGKIAHVSGKVSLYRQGVFDDVDLAFMTHCAGKGSIWCRQNSGTVKKKVIFHGKSCHAANPDCGNNAMNQLTLAQCAIGLLRERLTPTMRIHGIISDGGAAANVIPAKAEMLYYMRSSTLEELKIVSDLFDTAVTHAALALGGRAEIITFGGTLPIKPSPEMGRVFAETTNALMPELNASSRFVVGAGATDIGDISTIMPALHGASPGLIGTAHGENACTPDDELAYVFPVKQAVAILYELLKDNAARARKAMEEFGPKLTHEQYEAIRASIYGEDPAATRR